MKNQILISLLFFFFFTFGNGQTRKDRNIETLNIVWETMNTQYFDSTFNGLNWQDQYNYYKPIIAKCETYDTIFHYLNEMLFKLNVSHLFAIPPSYEDEIGSPQLFLDGTIGIDLRLINEEAIIISVKRNSVAYNSEIKVGYRIQEVNGKTIKSFIEAKKANPNPPYNDIHIYLLSTENIIRELYGTPGDSINISYVDEKNQEHHKTLQLENRSIEKVDYIPSLPPMYASIDKRIISDSIAYIHFDVFLPVILDSILSTIAEFHNYPNLIIDIRGNPGGDFNTRRTIAEQFVSEPTLFWKYQKRNDVNDVFLNPSANPYTGNVVILIDQLSSSSSEEFSGAMQAIGRATIIGQRTAGKVLTMEIVELPYGGLFVYPNQQTRTSKNEVLESVGVIPDIEVNWNKADLINGIDTQLDKAIEYFKKNKTQETKE